MKVRIKIRKRKMPNQILQESRGSNWNMNSTRNNEQKRSKIRRLTKIRMMKSKMIRRLVKKVQPLQPQFRRRIC